MSVTGGPAVVRGDPALLERLVGNLVENAVRHNVTGGWIRIRTGHRWHGTGCSRSASSGPVIDPARSPSCSSRSGRAGGRRTGDRGTGLGLSIVRAVVAAHDGTVGAPVPAVVCGWRSGCRRAR